MPWTPEDAKRHTKKARSATAQRLARATELMGFLQDVALGKRTVTRTEINEASEELDQLLPDAEADEPSMLLSSGCLQ